MPPEEAPEQTQETPVAPESAPEEGHAPQSEAPEHDWEKRYNDLRPAFDQTTAELKEFKEAFGHLTDPETQAQALEQYLNLQLAQEEAEQEQEQGFEDPYEELAARQAALEEYLNEQATLSQQQQEQEQVVNHTLNEIGALEQDLGRTFSEKETKLLAGYAKQLGDMNGNLPDVKAAYEDLTAVMNDEKRSWVTTKKAPRVAAGQSAEQAPDLSTREGRLQAAMGKMAALEEQ